jgi:allantoicase
MMIVQGKWMDGWETRRKRMAGHDWCIIRDRPPANQKPSENKAKNFVINSEAKATFLCSL